MTLFISSEILIFKTNITTDEQFATAALVLDAEPGIRKWNVDRQDVDHVLRVEGDTDPATIGRLLENAGLFCAELTD